MSIVFIKYMHRVITPTGYRDIGLSVAVFVYGECLALYSLRVNFSDFVNDEPRVLSFIVRLDLEFVHKLVEAENFSSEH